VGVLLGDLLTDAGQPPPGRGGDASAYDYESQARRILDSGHLTPRFPALFIDEAQDFGHDTLALLIALTEPGPEQRRPVMIFYDNAQDIYGRGTPRWADLGLDLRGRSDVMRESFRSTRANTELALEVLDRLRPLRQSPDLRELMRAGPGGTPPLLAHEHGRWRARFCVAEGQPPEVRILPDRDAELRLVTRQVYKWIVEDGVPPGDIRILALKNTRDAITRQLDQALGDHGRVVQRRSEGFVGCEDAVVVTTPHSFKGHDAELIVVVGVDGYVTSGRPLHAVLYVAMTRARTLLLVTGTTSSLPGSTSDQVITAVRDAADAVGSLHTEPLDPRLPA
jgi:superfamily I DNA/RNA helicase